MSYNTVVLFPCSAMDAIKKKPKDLVATIDASLHCVEGDNARIYHLGNSGETISMCKAESSDTTQLLMVKDGKLIDLLDCYTNRGEIYLKGRMEALRVAQSMMEVAECNLLLTIAQEVYDAISANGNIDIKSEEDVLEAVQNNVAIQHCDNPQYAPRVTAYIMKNWRRLRDKVRVCEI